MKYPENSMLDACGVRKVIIRHTDGSYVKLYARPEHLQPWKDGNRWLVTRYDTTGLCTFYGHMRLARSVREYLEDIACVP